jgi:hypothetical protein
MLESWPPLDTTFFETVDRRGIALTAALRLYLTNVVGIDLTPASLREHRMEEVFKDGFFDLNETPKDKVTHEGYVALVDLYIRVLQETTNWLCDDKRRGAPIGQLLAQAASRSDKLTVITFNHDLVIENEISRRQRLRQRWCLDRGYGSIGAGLRITTPVRRTAVFPLHSRGECDHTQPITVLKLHGSLNWIARLTSDRPTANFLLGKAGDRPIYLVPRRQVHGRLTYVREGTGRSSWDTWPVIVPPVYAKQALRSAVQVAWDDARTSLISSDRIVFFGYSLPDIDIEAQKLFERTLAKSPAHWVDVVNPSSASAARFAQVSKTKPVRWYPTLDDFFTAGSLG